MIYIVYGAVGVVAVLLLFIAGCFTGWKLHVAYEKHNRQVAVDNATEEEKKLFIEQQRAFDNMLNYNINQAYGLDDPLSELQKE